MGLVEGKWSNCSLDMAYVIYMDRLHARWGFLAGATKTAEKEEGGFWALGRKKVVTEARRRLAVFMPELLTLVHFQKLLVGFLRTQSWTRSREMACSWELPSVWYLLGVLGLPCPEFLIMVLVLKSHFGILSIVIPKLWKASCREKRFWE